MQEREIEMDSPHEPPLFDISHTESSASLASVIVPGAVAAAVGGAAWAIIVAVTEHELGMVAWGIGALVGAVMARSTGRRSPILGAWAAGLAAAGLVLGKALIGSFVMPGALANELRNDEEVLAGASFWDLEAHGAIPEDIQARLDELGPLDTIPDVLWTDLLQVGRDRLASMSDEERNAFAESFSSALVAGAGMGNRTSWQLSLFDLIWFGLAVWTAWGMMARPDGLEAAALAPSAGRERGPEGAGWGP